MASTLKRAVSKGVGVTPASIYTTPALSQAVLLGMNIANTSAQVVLVDIVVTVSAVDYYILKQVSIPVGSAFTPTGSEQKVIMAAGDTLKINSNVAASLDVLLSFAEIS